MERRRAITRILYGSAGLLALVAGARAFSSRSSPGGSAGGKLSTTTTVKLVATSTSILSQSTDSGGTSVRVAYFGMPLSLTGTKKETVKLNSHATLTDLKSAMAEMHPSLASMIPSMLFLVDGVSSTGDAPLNSNCEVDVLALAAGG